MRKILLFTILATLSLLFSVTSSYAQFTISDHTTAKPRIYREKLYYPKVSNFKNITPAYIKDQKRKIRHEKNFFETKTSIMFNQFAYVNWAGGGENSYNGIFSTLNTHSYRNNKLTVDSYLNAAIGLGEKGKDLWKTEDNLEINSVLNYQIWGKWTYSIGINFATQFAPGYGGDKDLYTSRFFAPATLKPFTGISYRYSDNQIITIAPISGNLLFVCDERLSNEGAFGVEPGKRLKTSLGSYINIQWTQKIDRKGILSYKTNMQVFCDYKTMPVVGWENWINVTVLKYLTFGLYLNVIYNNQITPQGNYDTYWQLSQNLGIGVAYNFKNKKEKPDNKKLTSLVKFDH